MEVTNRSVIYGDWNQFFNLNYRLMGQAHYEIKNGLFEEALKTLIIWHDCLDLDEHEKCIELAEEFKQVSKKATEELKRSSKSMSNDNKLNRIEFQLLKLHRLLQKGMYRKGMKYSEKKEIMPGEILANTRIG